MIFLFGTKLLITIDNITPVLANTVLFLCDQVADIRPRQTSGVMLSLWWRHWPENLRRIHTVKTARTLLLCCLFGNPTEYSAPCDVLLVQVVYKLRSVTKFAGSLSRSECLKLVTAVTFINIMVSGLVFGLCIPHSNTIFLLILHCRSLNIIRE